MRKLLFLVLVINSLGLYSQLDTKHYIPPMYGRTNVSNHYISIATLSTNPVAVTISRGNGTVLYNVTVTRISPSLINLGAGTGATGMIPTSNLNTINATDGLIVTATEPVFVNMRHVQSAQGLCLTSKGRFALGTDFRSGHLYNNQHLGYVKAHCISVMATENGTVVNFSDFSPNVKFYGTAATGNTSNPIAVTLNAGESYVIAAFADASGASGNRNDVNGTHITSNKPIAVNTGSWLGGGTGNSRDIGMDQIVPVKNTGSEYVFSEGNGPATNERTCVVAHSNGTQIYVNGSGTAIATINAGDYYFIPNGQYAGNGNIYIRTSEPSYIYQSLSGSSPASNGLNFIPPLRCEGVSEVNIPNVNLVGSASIFITARANANVYVNNNPIPIGGALPVTGNPFWVTYKVPGGSGNFSVTSDSVINVALLTLNGVRGSAGYFSGFAVLDEIDRGNPSDFVMCQSSVSSFIKMSMPGPYDYTNIIPLTTGLGGNLSVSSVSNDTVFFDYINNSSGALMDSFDVEICIIGDCGGSQVDTTCTVSRLVFNKVASINVGSGDSIKICPDTSSIVLFDVLIGSPIAGGTWTDEDGSGVLFNGVFQTSLVTSPGTYQFTYKVSQGICFDSSIVTIEVDSSSSVACCPIDPSFALTQINCHGLNNGIIQITDLSATQYSIDGGTNMQNSGTFTGLAPNTYNVRVAQGTSCFFDTTIQIIEPPLLSINPEIDSVLCSGNCDGKITMHPTGGVSPYTFQLNGSAYQLDSVYGSLCVSNSYNISVKDANGCVMSQNVSVLEPATLTVSLDSTISESCDMSNGIISVSAAGGTPGFQYSINGGTYQSSSIFTGLVAGNFTVLVRDTNNCTAQLLVTLTPVGGPIAYVDVLNHIPCQSGSNGNVLIGVSNGVPNFQYILNGGTPQSSNYFNALVAGSSSVIVLDNNGCSDTVSFIVTEPSTLTLSVTQKNVVCYDECNGEVYLDVTGSNPPYNYSVGGAVFSPVSFNQFDTIQYVCAQTNINIIVRDSLNCFTNTFITVTQPDSIQITPTNIDATCFGFCDGDITLGTLGGVGPFTYSGDNGTTFQAGNQFSNLCADLYEVVIKDANQCIQSDTIRIENLPKFSVTIDTITHTTCGNSGGAIAISIDDPLYPNYTFTNINTGISITNIDSAYFTNLSAGVYVIKAEDSNGCVDTMYVGVNDNSLAINLTPVSIIHVACNNECTGSFIVAANGGNTPYQFSINNGALTTNPGFYNLCAEEYVVLVQDATGCIETIQLEIFEPEKLDFYGTKLSLDCNSLCDGEIEFTNNIGGTRPYDFSIDNGITYFADSSFTNLCAGQYKLFLRDSNLCLDSVTRILTEPSPLNLNTSVDDLTCNGSADGLIALSAFGAIPNYQYSVNSGAFSTGQFYGGLDSGIYYIEVQDNNGCSLFDTLEVSEPVQNGLTVTKVENLCADDCLGSITLNSIGGTLPYLYSINNGTNFQSSNVFDSLCPGAYQLRVLDDNNCQINQLDSLLLIDTLIINATANNSACNVNNGDIDITAAGGTPNYTYSIDNITFIAANVFNSLAKADYQYYVLDANNCLDSGSISIDNFVSPQMDSIHSTLPCHGVCDASLTLFASGGNGAYEYSIDGGLNFQASNQFNGVCAGNFSIAVRDANGCSDTIGYFIVEPDTISILPVISPILCNGDSTGGIQISTQGGIGLHTYSFNAGAYTNLTNYTQLGIGNYTIDIQDELGCTYQFDTTITEPTPLQISLNNTPPTCFGLCNGTLEVNITGGIPGAGYTYNWSDFTNNDSIQNNVCAGLYSIYVVDNNGCSVDSLNFELTEPTFAKIDSATTIGVDCFGAPQGSEILVHMSAVAGGLYSFDGVNFTTTSQVNDLATGLYDVYTQDANGCAGDTLEVYIPTPSPLAGFVSADIIICPNELVFFTAVGTGGTLPYAFEWNNTAALNQAEFSQNVVANTTYFAEITDNNGCTVFTDSMEVTLTSPPTMTISPGLTICAGDSVYVEMFPDGQLDEYSFSWNTGGVDTLYNLSKVVNQNVIYTGTITDQCGQQVSDMVEIRLHTKPVVTFQVDTLLVCVPQVQVYKVNISPNSIDGSIVWTSNIGFIDPDSKSNQEITVNYEVPGNELITIAYSTINGCNYTDTVPSIISVNSSPTAAFVFAPEEPEENDVEIVFTNESTDPSGLGLSNDWLIESIARDEIHPSVKIDSLRNIFDPFAVCLTVENSFKCTDKVCKTIEITVDQLIFVPNAFTPDDRENSTFEVKGYNNDIYSFHIRIYNRWGELVFESYNMDKGWDGLYGKDIAQMGVYVWQIEVASQSDPDTIQQLKGYVSLIR